MYRYLNVFKVLLDIIDLSTAFKRLNNANQSQDSCDLVPNPRKKYAHGAGNQASDTRDTRLPLASNLVIKCAGYISVYIATTSSHHN